MTGLTEDYSATSNAALYSRIDWATTNNHCFVDVRPENLPWQTISTYQSNTSCPGDPICFTDWPSKKVWFGTWEGNGSKQFSYQCQYGNVFQAQGLHLYRLRDRAELTFRAPRQYGTNTSVLFTFDGVDYERPRDSQTGVFIEPLALSQVRFWGQPPVAWSNETQTVTYLISVDGGREYAINQDSFEWPQRTYLRELWGGAGPVLVTEDVHWMQVTNFHNQVEPMEVITGTYNGNDWAAVWSKLDLGPANVSAKNETDFKSGWTDIKNYVIQTAPVGGNKGVRYSAAINGNFFFFLGSDKTCTSIKGFVGRGASPWDCGTFTKNLGSDGGNRWGFGVTTNGPQHVTGHDVEDASGYYPTNTVQQSPYGYGMNNVSFLFANGAPQDDATWPYHDNRKARSLLVWSKDQKHLFMIVVAYPVWNPLTGTNAGLTWSDTIDFVRTSLKAAVGKKLPNFDIGDAIMLDGGSSTQLSFRKVSGDLSNGGTLDQQQWEAQPYHKDVPDLVHTYATIPQN